jgi:hypothetical protein
MSIFTEEKDGEQSLHNFSRDSFWSGGYYSRYYPTIRIVADVPPEKGMRADVCVESRLLDGNHDWNNTVVIHVHSAKDIAGGGWTEHVGNAKYQKTVHRETIVIE